MGKDLSFDALYSVQRRDNEFKVLKLYFMC